MLQKNYEGNQIIFWSNGRNMITQTVLGSKFAHGKSPQVRLFRLCPYTHPVARIFGINLHFRLWDTPKTKTWRKDFCGRVGGLPFWFKVKHRFTETTNRGEEKKIFLWKPKISPLTPPPSNNDLSWNCPVCIFSHPNPYSFTPCFTTLSSTI